MSPFLIQTFAFMTCTFLLGLFVGFALWRYGGVTSSAIADLEAKVDFLKKSLDKSRMELWNAQDDAQDEEEVERPSRAISRRRVSESLASDGVPTPS
ncbi:MAG: hypothetical protein AAFR73_01615 [Pseudomonadota bacterium]